MVRWPIPALPCAAGETSFPGASQHRIPRSAGAHHRPALQQSASSPSGPALAGAACQPIPCGGEKQLHLSFNAKAFCWWFLLATVQFSIMEVDFLRHYRLLVELASNQLVDRPTSRVFRGSSLLLGDTPLMTQTIQPGELAPPWGRSAGSPASFCFFSGLSLRQPASSGEHQPLRESTGLFRRALASLRDCWPLQEGTGLSTRPLHEPAVLHSSSCSTGGGLRCLTCKSVLRVLWDILGGRHL